MKTRVLIASAIAAALSMIAWTTGADARPLGARVLAPGCPTGAVCGVVMRPLDPTGHVPGEIPIEWRMYPHTGPTKLGVIVAQEGGPGYPSTDSAFGYRMLFQPLRKEYDLLLVNARGTGQSAVHCPSVDNVLLPTIDQVGECGTKLGPRSGLYGTRLAAQDMKAVLDQLGITQFTLYGDSYGTFFSHTFVALYPDMLRAVVLDGTYPVIGQSPWYPENAETVTNGITNVCLRMPYCAALPGTSLERIRNLIAAAHNAPIHGTAPDGEGVPREVDVTPGAIGYLLYGGWGLLVPRDLDAAARAYFDGDSMPILRMMAETTPFGSPGKARRFSYGLFAAVSCTDYQQIFDMNSGIRQRIAQRRAAIAAQRAADPDFYDPLGFAEFLTVPIDTSVIDLCLKWPLPNPAYPPGKPIPPHKPFTSAPTLVINGELDPLTAPGGGAIVAAQFPNAQHIVMANSFHVDAIFDTDGCASEIVRRFVATLDAGDTSCAANIRPVRLVPNFPRRAEDATPATPNASNTATTEDLAVASAAVQTAGDVVARWWINYSGKGAGLHGGHWSYTGATLIPQFTLDGVKWVRAFPVSGTARWNGNTGKVTASLTYTNRAGESAQLDVEWNDRTSPLATAQIRGTVGGRTIRATMPAP